MGIRIGMAPTESPNQFVAPEGVKRNIRTLNNFAVYGLILAVSIASGALAFEAASRGRSVKSTADSAGGVKGKPLASHPPTDLEAKKSATATHPGSVRDGTVPQVEATKEQQEFDRQLRLEQQKVRLTKASLAASAETSDIAVDISRAGEGAAVTSSATQAALMMAAAGPGLGGGAPGPGLHLTGLGNTGGGLTADPNLQGRKEAFAAKEAASGYLPTRKQAQLSPYEVKQGTVIPGIMISGINSDLPGQIIAQVSQNVYDTATGKHLLIPQGTRLVGSYDSYVAIGQERAMVAWRRLQFPDGAALDILNMPGADEGGYAGFNDQVNNHYLKIFGSAIMLSLVGAGYQLSQPTQHVGDPISAQDIVAAQVGQQLSQVSGELIRRNMQIQPTIEIRPGYRFNIMVNKDMILEPYEEHDP